MLKTFHAKLKNLVMLFAQTVTATFNSTSLDLADYVAASIEISVGTMAFDGSNYLTLLVQHSDDNSTFSNVGEGDLFSGEDVANGVFKVLDAGTDDESTYLIHYTGNKRYVRLRAVETGTVSVAMSVTGLLKPKNMPA